MLGAANSDAERRAHAAARRFSGSGTVQQSDTAPRNPLTTSTRASIRALRQTGGNTLAESLQHRFEAQIGAELGMVRVH